MRRSIVVIATLALALARHAHAHFAQECQVRVLQSVTDDSGHRWPVGSVLPATILRDGPEGASYCASGGSCLPLKVNGSDTLHLLNCKVGPSLGDGDRRLIPDPQRAGHAAAATMRSRDEAERRLSGMGFSNASAGSLAAEYVKEPGSARGRLVAQALAGSSAARARLKSSNP